MKILNLTTITILLASCLSAQSNKDRSGAGEAIFQEKCAGCHGTDGRAQTEIGKKMGAADLTSASVQQLSDSQLMKIVKDGKEKMPAFDGKLDKGEIRDVLSYIRELAKKP